MIISDNVRRAAAVEYERKARAPAKITQPPFHSCFGGVLVNFDQKSWH
jgi:hypothetical protein